MKEFNSVRDQYKSMPGFFNWKAKDLRLWGNIRLEFLQKDIKTIQTFKNGQLKE